MRTLNLKMIVLCVLSLGLNAQQKVSKTKQAISVNKDVVIDLNTNYVEVEVDTWNKDTVEVEAYLESAELSEAELKEAAKGWILDINGSTDYVSIKSSGSREAFYFASNDGDYTFYLKNLEKQLANMPKIPQMAELPELPEMPELPELPEFPEGVHGIEFDIDTYKRDGEEYMKEWSKEYEETYGKDFRKDMEAWAKKFADSDYQKKMEAWGEEYAKRFGGKWAVDMEKWGEEFGEQFGEEWAEKLEKWGEEFGRDFEKQMESWARRYEREMEREARDIERMARELERREMREEQRAEALERRTEAMRARGAYFAPRSESKVKKVIKIKIPKKAKLKVQVRHGELTFASVIYDLEADVAYAPFKATEIDGGSTSINVSYAPFIVGNWKLGELNLNYVDDAILNSAEHIILTSNSSNIELVNLNGNALIEGSFGDLDILNIANSFNNLNITVENSQARIALPKTSHNLQFKGSRSRLLHPDKDGSNASSFSAGDLSSGKTIVINAKFSTVSMQ